MNKEANDAEDLARPLRKLIEFIQTDSETPMDDSQLSTECQEIRDTHPKRVSDNDSSHLD